MHIADCHLGKKQYGLDERLDDFGKAFDWVCEEAIREGVHFILCSGDLFDTRNINAYVLEQAVKSLNKLIPHNIMFFVSVGNHDRTYYRDKMGWLEYLCDEGFVRYVKEDSPYRYMGCDITSLGYTNKIPEKYSDSVTPPKEVFENFQIIMLHAGLEGIVPNMGGCISKNDLNILRDHCDYLALGHIHEPYELEGWVFNPGSLERWNISESEWDGGYYLVDVETPTREFKTKHVPSPKRPMHRINISQSNEVEKFDFPDNSIVEITLVGEQKEKPDVEFTRGVFLKKHPCTFYVKVVDKTTRPSSLSSEPSKKDRTLLEREAIDSLTNDSKLTELVLSAKSMIDEEPEEILKVIGDECS